MNQQYQQLDSKAIEALKAARNQVIQADKRRNEDANINKENPAPKQVYNKFAEEFVQKLASVEKEKAAIDEEMANVEKLWSSLVEKKKKLEGRRNELIKVKDKLQELDKEMSNVLKSQSFDKLRIDPEQSRMGQNSNSVLDDKEVKIGFINFNCV